MLRLFLALSLVVVGFWNLPAAAAELNVRDGDKFTYRKSDPKGSLEFTSTFRGTDHAGRLRFDRKVLGKNWPANEEARTPEGALVYDKFTKFDPHDADKFSATVGESWTVSFTRENKREGTTESRTVTCTVVAVGPHTVTAGTFTASRVDCAWAGGKTTTWYDARSGMMIAGVYTASRFELLQAPERLLAAD